MRLALKQHSVLPGFGLTLGYTVLYLSLIVLIPLSALFVRTASMSWSAFWQTVADPRVVASYRLTFGASLIGAAVNAVFGFIVAWTLVRYRFPGRKLLDALVDLPFALPTAVSGIALTAIYARNGWIGRVPGAAGDQGRVLAAGRHAGLDVHRPAVRRPHLAAGVGRAGRRVGGSGPQPGREPLADVLARDPARRCCRRC